MKKNSIKSKKRIHKTKLKNRQIKKNTFKKNRHLQKYNTRKKIIGGNASEIKRLLLDKLPEIKTNLERLRFPQIYNIFFSRSRIFKSKFDKTVALISEVYSKLLKNDIKLNVDQFIEDIVTFFNSNDPIYIINFQNKIDELKNEGINIAVLQTLVNRNSSLQNLKIQDFNGRLDILSKPPQEDLLLLLLNYILLKRKIDQYSAVNLEKSKILTFFKENINNIIASYEDERYIDFFRDSEFLKNFITKIIDSYDNYLKISNNENLDMFTNIILHILRNKAFINIFIENPSSDISDTFISEAIKYITKINGQIKNKIINCKKTNPLIISQECCLLYPNSNRSTIKPSQQRCIDMFDKINENDQPFNIPNNINPVPTFVGENNMVEQVEAKSLSSLSAE